MTNYPHILFNKSPFSRLLWPGGFGSTNAESRGAVTGQDAPLQPIRTASAGARRAFSDDLSASSKPWLHVFENTLNKVAAYGTISLASRRHSRDQWSCKGTA